jgi:Zn-dependent M28 family amino/carboxypeptidase
MRKIIVILLLGIAACTDLVRKAEESISTNDLARDIATLSADSMLGRSPLTAGETRAVAYIESRMKELGLEPAFGSSYTQTVPLVELTTLIPDILKIKTPKGFVQLKSEKEYTLRSMILREKVEIKAAELIFAGFGISAPDYGWNDFEGIDVRGKIIVVIVNDPGFFTGDTSLFNGNAMTYYGRWRYKFEEAERQGALGCLIVHEEAAAGYPWEVSSIRTNKPDYYLDNNALIEPKCLVSGWINSEPARRLFAACGFDYEEMKRKATLKGFKAIPMNATLDISVQNLWSKANSRNVAGYVKGSEKPDEVIVYCGHWDHLGVGKAVDGDSIYNGASDNAAAVAWMFSIAKAFKSIGKAPKRSVLFLSPTAEEAGLLGSTYFVDSSPFAIEKTIACINNDVILFLGKFNDVTVTGLGHSDLDELLRTEATKRGRYIESDPNPENGMFFRSDQLPFLKAGVPSIFAKGYSHQETLGKEKTQEKINEYWKSIYHKPADEYVAERDNLEGLAEDAKLFFGLGYRLATENIYPRWNRRSEFYKDKR